MKRPTLNDNDCRRFLREMRAFGYPNLKLEEVQRLAEQIGNGEDVSGNVIGVFMQKTIDDALEAKRWRV